MKRLALALGCLMLMAMPAMAITEFNKQWKAKFLSEDASAEFKRAAKKAGCNVCHVKGKKKDVVNSFGKEVGELVKDMDITQRIEKVKKEDKEVRDAVREELTAEFDKILDVLGKKEAPSGKTYAEAIAAGEVDGARPKK